MTVRITHVAVAHPPGRIARSESVSRIGRYADQPRRVAALARGTGIDCRAIAIPADELPRLGLAGQRNDLYRAIAPGLALEAGRAATACTPVEDIACLVTTSCTGYMAPSLGVQVARGLGLRRSTPRLPFTEAGCAGGVLALATAVDQLRSRGGRTALAASVELCSLAFHPGGDDGNLTSTLIFGDGAGAAVLESGEGAGLEVLDAASALVPNSEEALGFDLTDQGFYPRLSRELPSVLRVPLTEAVRDLLARHCLQPDAVGAWLIHPGGPRILRAAADAFCLDRGQMSWSWDSLREFGNTSSAAIFDVLRRYLEEPRPDEYAVAAAFGPGVSIELLLLRRTTGG